MSSIRKTNYPVEPLFLSRWSPRAYDASNMPAQDLLTILEAGRWAPSAYNIQPWRFLYAHRADAHWPDFASLLNPFNQQWATKASALIFLLSDTIMPGDGNRADARSQYNSFDAGAAWAQIALQATALGYSAHAMAGLIIENAPRVLAMPDRYRLEVAIAIGRRIHRSTLSDDPQSREIPSDRIPLDHIAFNGSFPERYNTIAAE